MNNSKFAWAQGDVETLTGQEYARTVSQWDWGKFEKLKPEIRICIRETKKDKTPVAYFATYALEERDGYKWVNILFEYGDSPNSLSINQFEISACLNAPERYQPKLNQRLSERFFSLTLKLA